MKRALDAIPHHAQPCAKAGFDEPRDVKGIGRSELERVGR